MDFITDLPPSRNNKVVYDAILVIVDRFSKMSLYIPAEKTWRAEDLADSFVERVISRFGVPKGVVSDRGSIFISRMWVEICTVIKQKRCLSRLATVWSGPDRGLFWRPFKKTGLYGPAPLDCSSVPKILDQTVQSGLFIT